MVCCGFGSGEGGGYNPPLLQPGDMRKFISFLLPRAAPLGALPLGAWLLAAPHILIGALLGAALTTHAAPLPPTPEVDATAYVLRDFHSNDVLIAKNPDLRVDPASLTKLMTAYLVFKQLQEGALKMDQVVPVTEKAWRAPGSRMFIDPKKPVTVEQLLHGVIIQSGNDASIALAQAVAGSEETFAHMMNEQARRLGMKNSHFMNSTGLPDPEHYSTAADMSLLAAAIIRDFPKYYSLYSIRDYTYNDITQLNRNRLLWLDPTVDGMKTGHTEAAGYCLVTSAHRGPRRLISVVTGEKSDNGRVSTSQKLLNYGFQFFETARLYRKGESLAKLPVWKGSRDSLVAGIGRDVFVALPKGDAQRIKVSMETEQPILAPLSAGQKIGVLSLSLDGRSLGQYPLVALQTVEPAGMLGKLWDGLRLWLQ